MRKTNGSHMTHRDPEACVPYRFFANEAWATSTPLQALRLCHHRDKVCPYQIMERSPGMPVSIGPACVSKRETPSVTCPRPW